MSVDKRARLKEWLQSGEARLHNLTLPQRELWETSAVPAGDVSNHICTLLFIEGAITETLSQAALQDVVNHQEALRTSILPGKGAPLQMIRKTVEANYEFRELSPGEGTPESVEALAVKAFHEPFDMVQGPLYRVLHLQVTKAKHVLVFAAHHAIADGWSLGVFVQDLCMSYLKAAGKMPVGISVPPMTYTAWGAADKAYWQPALLEERAAFWKKHLAGYKPLWPDAKPDPSGSYTLQRVFSYLPAELATATREMVKRSGATLFSTLLAAFRLTLLKWTGRDDVVIGSPVANRAKNTVKDTMGYFAGNVPMRSKVDPARRFSDIVRDVHEESIEAFANAMPFAELAPAVGDPESGKTQHPIYDVRFALQNHPMPDMVLPGISVKLKMRSTGTARFDLGCEITEEGETMEAVWLFRPHRFAEKDIQELDVLFQSVLAAGCRSPETGIAVLLNNL